MPSGDLSLQFTTDDLQIVEVDAEGLRPDVDEVALLLRTHTAGNLATGLGGDTAGGELTTFTAKTRPTADEAGRIIDMAFANVTGELADIDGSYTIPVAQIGQIRHAIALYAAVLILTSFFDADTAGVQTFRDLYAGAIRRVSAAITGTDRSGRMVSATMASPYSGDDTSGGFGLDFATP